MNDFEKIEHLLLSKRFEELSPTEVKEVSNYFENAVDYNDMRETLMQVKSTLATDKLLIKPSVDLKEKLLQKFEETHTQNNNSTKGRIVPFYKRLAFQWSAAAVVVIVLSVSIFNYMQSINVAKHKNVANNYDASGKKDKKESPSFNAPSTETEKTSASSEMGEHRMVLRDTDEETIEEMKSTDESYGGDMDFKSMNRIPEENQNDFIQNLNLFGNTNIMNPNVDSEVLERNEGEVNDGIDDLRLDDNTTIIKGKEEENNGQKNQSNYQMLNTTTIKTNTALDKDNDGDKYKRHNYTQTENKTEDKQDTKVVNQGSYEGGFVSMDTVVVGKDTVKGIDTKKALEENMDLKEQDKNIPEQKKEDD